MNGFVLFPGFVSGVLPDQPLLLPLLALALVLGSLLTSTLALRRSRTLTRSSEALMAELAVFKDAAVSLGQHLDRRGTMPLAAAPVADRHAPHAAASAQPVYAQTSHAQTMHARTEEGPLSSAPANVPDTRRGFELARQGASIDDLVAACDVSRTEAGLMLAMSRRGRRVPGA